MLPVFAKSFFVGDAIALNRPFGVYLCVARMRPGVASRKGRAAMCVMRAVRRVVLVFVLALIGGALVQPPEASAETMSWRVKSNYKYKVQIAFYSQTRSHEWPGDGDAYNLNDSDTHDYTLRCEDGEKVCLGGWVTGNAGKY